MLCIVANLLTKLPIEVGITRLLFSYTIIRVQDPANKLKSPLISLIPLTVDRILKRVQGYFSAVEHNIETSAVRNR